jgi:hypothetical protein
MARLCAAAPPGTNRAMFALPVKRMLDRPFGPRKNRKLKEHDIINPLVEMVFICEIVTQLSFAEKFSRKLSVAKDSIETWSCIQSILIAIANISKILWPSSKQYIYRGEELRKVLEVKNDNLISDRKFRNHFEHYDERIDEWFKENKSALYIDKKIDFFNRTPFDFQTFSHRGYDPVTNIIYFRGDSLDLNKVFCALKEIREGCNKYGFKMNPIN